MGAKKKQKLRNNEYYSIQEVFDNLYKQSKNGKKFKNLLDIIVSEENILLAYRNIKKNKGSKTSGTNKKNIVDIAKDNPEKLINYVRNRLSNFKPHSVRRVEIDKSGGGTRPLGIPTIEDRIIQQCIKQVLEPICEAKFHPHSYGFRPNRATRHAIARTMFLAHVSGYQFVVDIDIKGFFDNVNHAKLIKQMWSMGIQDKNLICIISKMLKSEIKGVGIPTKGVPQGGILSPLLSNIVLNEFDWWISSQWETHKMRNEYKSTNSQRNAMRKTKLKPVFIVRYADDFKLLCRNCNEAQRLFIATQNWLKERLQLEVSSEKSKVINLKKKYSDFLGFKLKLHLKSDKWVVKSHIKDKAKIKILQEIKEKIKLLQKRPTHQSVSRYNACILGLHNYYSAATHVYRDFKRIGFIVEKNLRCRLRKRKSNGGVKSKAYMKFYERYKGKAYYVCKIALFPVRCISHQHPLNFTQEICNYTNEGREKIHDRLAMSNKILKGIIENPVFDESVEFNDNRISLYVGQSGKCGVTRKPLTTFNMEVHHIIPKQYGGTDEYSNLIYISSEIHKLIHATDPNVIAKHLGELKLNKKPFEKLNLLREKAQNCKL